MKNIGHIQHLHSNDISDSGVKLPSSNQLLDGEIAINNKDGNEIMAIKSDDGNIATFSSDNVIMPKIGKIESNIDDLNYVVSMLTSNSTSGARGYGEESPTLQMMEGDKEKLWSVLRHFKMGWFDGEGRLVRECKGGCISVDVDGNDIPIDGSLKDVSGNSCDLMVYVDTDIYVDRCTVDWLNIVDSNYAEHNVIGLGIMPHKVGNREAKKFEPFGFTPHCANYHDVSGKTIGYSYYSGEYTFESASTIDSSVYALNKGGGYMGLYYEFYEIWLIAMYLELGTLNFTQQNMFGCGITNYTPTENNWFSDLEIGAFAYLQKPHKLLTVTQVAPMFEYSYLLEPHKMIDAIVKGGFASDIGGTMLYYVDKDGNAVKAPSTIDVTRYDGIGDDDTNRYFTVRNVEGCQGIADGVMTAVVNIYYKVPSKNVICKESHPIYRGIDLLSGFFLQTVGIHYLIRQDEEHLGFSAPNKELFYATDWRQVSTDIELYTAENGVISGDTNPNIIPRLIYGYNRTWVNENSIDNWIKECDYNISLFAYKTIGDRNTTYECQYTWGRNASYSSILGADDIGHLTSVGQSLNAFLVGSYIHLTAPCRGLNCARSISHANGMEGGAFSHPQIKLS